MTYESAQSVLGQNVLLRVEITGPGTVSEQAVETIRQLLTRECERVAQIAGVDVRDQVRARMVPDPAPDAVSGGQDLHAAPRGATPKRRGHTVLMAGVKGPEGRIVLDPGEPAEPEGDR